MAQEKRLKISPKNERVGLCIHCTKCKGTTNGGICVNPKDENKGGYCKTPEKHTFKLEFYKPGKKKRTKHLATRDEKLAAEIAVQEYNFFKVHGCFSDDQQKEGIVENKPISLFDWIQSYIAFKVKPTRNRIPIEKETLKDYVRHMDILIEALFQSGINAKTIQVSDLQRHTQLIFDFLKKKTQDGTTQSKYFRTYKAFWNYLVDEEYLQLPANPFNGWHFDKKFLSNEIIYENEFEALLKSIDALPKFERPKGTIRQRHYDWLRNAFKLSLYMGIRRQDVPLVKWNGIYLNRTTQELYGGIIQVIDKKLSKTFKREIYQYVSINMDLAELLVEMGYEKFKGQDLYIIDSEEELTRNHIKNCLSNSFAYYIRSLGLKRELSFECLRKTYATNSRKAGGENFSVVVTKHSNPEVMRNHYWNKLEAARTHEVFPRIFVKD